MAQLYVYLPDDLYDAMKELNLPASELLQEALRAEIRRLEALVKVEGHVEELLDEVAAVQQKRADGEARRMTTGRAPLLLLKHGEKNLLARSQARRLLVGYERYREVELDFAGVEAIGQAFADEVFRVFVEAHPDTHLTWVRASGDVERMIHWARGTANK